MKKQATGSGKAFFSKLGTSCNIQVRADLPLEVAIEQANCGKEFGGDDWVYILQRNPNLSGYCEWHKLSADNWGDLLWMQPQLVHWCDCGKLDGADWSLLLQRHPSLDCVHTIESMVIAKRIKPANMISSLS